MNRQIVVAVIEKGKRAKKVYRPKYALSENLTPAETTVLKLLCQGLSDKIVADILEIEADTVKRHLTNIRMKLNLVNDNRVGLVLYALREGIGKL